MGEEISPLLENPYIEETISELYARAAMPTEKNNNLFCELAPPKADELFEMLESKYANQTKGFYSVFSDKSDDDPHLPSFLRMAIDNRMSGMISDVSACDRYISAQRMDFKPASVRTCLR